MSNLVPSRNNRNREAVTPFDFMRNFFSDPFFSSFPSILSSGGIRADVRDNGDEYLIEADMPGISKDRINLDVHNDVLTISVNEEYEHKDEREDYLYRERRMGSMSRSFALDNVREDGIRAEYRDGVLSVHLPKEAEVKPQKRRIDIQ